MGELSRHPAKEIKTESSNDIIKKKDEKWSKSMILTTLSTETPNTSVFSFSNSAYLSLKAVISTRHKDKRD